jgi:7,8-dihydroneopterin aldolase/epimerase/oxygenase
MSDLIRLHGLAASALIGVYDWERTARRPLRLDLDLELDLRAAGQSDAVADTVDYAAVTAAVEAVVATESPQLLERLAEQVLTRLFAEFAALTAITLTVHKPGILPQVEDVAIRLRRPRPR